MKKTFAIIISLLTFSVCYSQNGNNLVFNKVIDTIFTLEISTCIYLSGNPQYSNEMVVPEGKVWKITSFGHVICNGNLAYKTSISGSGFAEWNNCTKPGNTTPIGELIRSEGNNEYIYVQNSEKYNSAPVWLSEESEIQLKLSTLAGDAKTDDIKCTTALSIIEFNVSQ